MVLMCHVIAQLIECLVDKLYVVLLAMVMDVIPATMVTTVMVM